MSRKLFQVAGGLSDGSKYYLSGSGAPGGDTAFQDAAGIGSQYQDLLTGVLYAKDTAGAGASNWKAIATAADVAAITGGLSWREPVKIVDTTATSTVAALADLDVDDLIQGAAVLAGDRMLFSAIALSPNVYIVGGSSGAWTLTEDTNEESAGDTVQCLSGDNSGRMFQYNGTAWNWIGQNSSNEDGFIRAFIGKGGVGSELPAFTTEHHVTNGQSLETAIGVLDAAIKGNDDDIGALQTNVTNLDTEMTNTQAGAGLGVLGAYTANGAANYIASATNLKNADDLLDAALKAVDDRVGNTSSYTSQTVITNGDDVATALGLLDAAIAAAGSSTELDNLEAALGAVINGVDGTFVLAALDTGIYMDAATTVTEAMLMLDAAVDANATAIGLIPDNQAELDGLEVALGAMIDANGDFVLTALDTGDYMDAATTTTEALLLLDAQLSLVTTGQSDYLLLAGGTMTGGITMSGASQISLGGNVLANVGDGVLATDGVNKGQLDLAQAGLLVKVQCEAASVVALPANTPSGSQVGKALTADANGILIMDTVSIQLDDFVLVKDEVAAVNNGIYLCTQEGTAAAPFVLTRSEDFDGNPNGEVKTGVFTFINSGADNYKSGWALAEAGLTGGGTPPIAIVDTDPLTFNQFQGLPQYTAGTGLDLTGNSFSVLMGAGIAEVPGGEVGVAVRADSGLMLTTDGIAASTASGAELSLMLADGTLTMGATGLAVSAAVLGEIDAIEASLGPIVDGAGAWDVTQLSGTNYLTTAAHVTDTLLTLDQELGTISGTVGDLSTFWSNLIASMGGLLSVTGTWDGFIGTNYLDAATDVNDGFVALDTQVKANADAIAGIGEGLATSASAGITTATVVDSLLVDDYDVAKWIIEAQNADQSKKYSVEVLALHDGSTSADATGADWNEYGKLRVGGNITGFDIAVTVSGVGAAQAMELTIVSTEAVDIKATRLRV